MKSFRKNHLVASLFVVAALSVMYLAYYSVSDFPGNKQEAAVYVTASSTTFNINDQVITNVTTDVLDRANGKRVGTVPAGTKGTVTAQVVKSGGKQWVKVSFSGGIVGWVNILNLSKPDVTAPVLKMLSPLAGIKVSPYTVFITIDVKDDSGKIKSLKMYMDGNLVKEFNDITNGTYTTSVNNISLGSHVFGADATDYAGNLGVDPVTITVENVTIDRVTGIFTATFGGAAGVQYTVEKTTSLSTPNWIVVGTPVANAEGVFTYSESIYTSTQGYFRASTNVVPPTGEDITSGLLGHWKFNEASGSTATDSSGTGNTGTLVNSPTRIVGKSGLGNAVSLDGTDDRVSVGGIDIGAVHTASLWIDFRDASDGVLLGQMGTSPGYVMYADQTNIYYNSSGNSGSDYLAFPHGGLSAGTWNHVVIVRNGRSVSLYKNGSLLATKTLATDGVLNSISAIGSYGNGNFVTTALVDDVRIYNRALTAAQISALYAYTEGPVPPPSNTPPTVSLTASPVSGTAPLNVALSAVASDSDGTVSKVDFYNGATNVLISTDSSSPSPFTASLSSLVAGTYAVYAKATDNAGAVTTSNVVQINVSAGPATDTEKPTIPTNLTATAVSAGQINLSWPASTDNIGVTGYKIYRSTTSGGTYTLVASVGGTTFSNFGLAPVTTYYYKVSAYDGAPNESDQSTYATATTQEAGVCPSMTKCPTSGDSATIQGEINSVSDGWTVQVPAGNWTWTSTVTISGKGIHLKGAGAGRVVGRSTTELTIGTGAKAITTQAGLPITAGQTLTVERTGGGVNPDNGNPTYTRHSMTGTVTSYSGTSLTMNITSTVGSGTHPLWIISSQAETTVTHNVSGRLINLTEDNDRSIELSGIRLLTGIGTDDYILMSPGGGMPILIHDMYFESTANFDSIQAYVNRGVIWNSSFAAFSFSTTQLAIHHKGDDNAWASRSTMGMADTTGKKNLYIEDSDFHAYLNATDYDDNSRSVMRRNVFNNAGFGTHGADSSLIGVRHFEVYDNQFIFNNLGNNQSFNNNWWFFIRGGTGVFTGNSFDNINSQAWGDKSEFRLAALNLKENWDGGVKDHECWGAGIAGAQYAAPRQVGRGNVTGAGLDGKQRITDNAGYYVGDSEPLYIWSNTGTYSITIGEGTEGNCTNPDSASDYIVAGRDYFNGTAKPGYTRYTYPHPLRTN